MPRLLVLRRDQGAAGHVEHKALQKDGFRVYGVASLVLWVWGFGFVCLPPG